MANMNQGRHFASKKERRKYRDREGFMKTKINKRPTRSDAKYSPRSSCIKNCAICFKNKYCTKLPYL